VSETPKPNALAEKLEELINAAKEIRSDNENQRWFARVMGLLSQIVPAAAQEINKITAPFWLDKMASQVGFLEGLVVRIRNEERISRGHSEHNQSLGARSGTAAVISGKVFLVHGHDRELKEAVARFLQHIGLQPIILHEQPNAGRTVIEKFEVASDVGFAVILLTPDDTCAPSTKLSETSARARQNVVLELGYFMGKLSRNRVCALYKPPTELPSDIHGIAYVEVDEAGAWKTKLAQELVEAGLTIDLKALLSA
jgi:predicted nucleotide-binding protein